MTVGISMTHGSRLEAIVITDSCVSMGGRESNSVNKVGTFSSEDYHGVIFGSGSGNYIEGILKSLPDVSADSLEKYVEKIQEEHRKRVEKDDTQILASNRARIKQKAEYLNPENLKEEISTQAETMPEEARPGFIHRKLEQATQKYDQFIEQENRMLNQQFEQMKQKSQTAFAVVGFENGKIRKFYISESGYNELFGDHIEIGSGHDGANMYFAQNLQGISVESTLSTADLAFLVVNAYNSSSINSGVSGARIVHVNEEGAAVISPEKTNALVNVSAAYMARVNEELLTHAGTRKHVAAVLAGKKDAYKAIASALEQTEEAIKSMVTPYSSWQAKANQLYFS